MRVEYSKCDGCGRKIGEGHKASEAVLSVRAWFASRDYDVCRDCWCKMCATVGLNPDIKSTGSAAHGPLSAEGREALETLRAEFASGEPRAFDQGERRVAIAAALTDGYCTACGRHIGDGVCHCQNDE